MKSSERDPIRTTRFAFTRQGLFRRIFVWFWLTMMLLWVVVVAIAVVSGSGLIISLWSRGAGSVLALCGEAAAGVYEREGGGALAQHLKHLQSRHNIRLYVFDESNAELAGQTVPPQVKALAARAVRSDRIEFALATAHPLIAKSLIMQSGSRYVVVREAPRPLLGVLYEELRGMAPKLILAFLLAGALCYWLARHLTKPINRLQAAVRKFAAGDLTVRVGRELAKRQDEISALGRDFDFMAERIETLMTSQNRLLRDVSHELRSPLTRLSVALELARQRSSVPEDGAWDRIRREADRLNELIGQLLTLSRLESGVEAIAKEPFALTELLQTIAVDADFEARSRKRWVRMVAVEPVSTVGNKELLRSAIENVVRNAVRHTSEGTEVEVSLAKDFDQAGLWAVVSVLDHGNGVPEGVLGDLFRPFYQVAEGREHETGASGIGLAITERAVKLHGGTLTVANSQGCGLLVEIRLPVGLPSGG